MRTSQRSNTRCVPVCCDSSCAGIGLSPDDAAVMRHWEHGGGFSLDAKARMEARNRAALESQGHGWPCWALLRPPDLCRGALS